MKHYSYSPETGEYEYSGETFENPMAPGVYLLPGHATFVAPQESKPRKTSVWNGAAWELKDDLRGCKFWNKKTKEYIAVKEIGEIYGDEWTEKEPVDFESAWNGTEWEIPFAVLKSRKIAAIRSESDAELARIQSGYSQGEIISWSRQEAGARELTATPDAATPDAEFVRAMAAARGIPAMDLVGKIMENLSPYAETMAAVLGNQQRREDLVKLATAPEDLETI